MDDNKNTSPYNEDGEEKQKSGENVGIDPEAQEQLKKTLGDLGKAMGEATKIMMDGFSEMLTGFAQTMSEVKFTSFSDLLGGADGEWRCDLLSVTVRIADPELYVTKDGAEETKYSCSVEVNNEGSTVKNGDGFGVFRCFEYYAPKLLEKGMVKPEYLLAVISEEDGVKQAIRFTRVKKDPEENKTEKE